MYHLFAALHNDHMRRIKHPSALLHTIVLFREEENATLSIGTQPTLD